MSAILSKKIHASGKDDPDTGLVLMHWCPGCNSRHLINVEKPLSNGATWSWNKNAERPTFTPSINIVGQCHYVIQDGQITFCDDSKHHLRGKTVPLPDIPEHVHR